MPLKILLVGSGGREHALAWKLAQSSLVEYIFVAPGNGGTAVLGGKVQNVAVRDDFESLLKVAIEKKINLLVPGPEKPLVDGIVDYFREYGPASIQIFGPTKAAARMEGSKAFSKDFMLRHRIPTASYKSFTSHTEASEYMSAHPNMRVVIKASGLAAGKGVIIPSSHEEAQAALKLIMLDKEFGAAGDAVVVEEFLDGDELSVLSFSDGHSIKSMPAAQDHKQIFDGDKGPNTGGMGCYAPTSVARSAIMDRIHKDILQPTIDGMRQERMPFNGCLFTGVMMTSEGPKVLEYNIRFGDPETQTLLPLLESDLAELMLACTGNYLSSVDVTMKPGFSATVVLASAGYPGHYEKGTKITLENYEFGINIFHAGTTLDPSSNVLKTCGGRVIAANGVGYSIYTAVQKAYSAAKSIHFDGMHYRNDIAHRALNHQEDQDSPFHKKAPLTYAGAGVSVDAGHSMVTRIKPFVRSTARPGVPALIGGFGGEIDLAGAGYGADAPRLIAAIDGIGTKVKIAKEMDDYSTVGIDLVAMNVNDLIVQGAEPLAFLDYYACSHLDVEHATAFVKSVTEGCKQANCGLVGGETAEMPSLYQRGDFDAAGCAIGALKRFQKILPDKASMQAGDMLIGLLSTGPHSNGFSLIRTIVAREGLAYTSPAPWDLSNTPRSVGSHLLTPTRIYVKSLVQILGAAASEEVDPAKQNRIKGLAHITGGGLVENIPRMLPDHLAAKLQIGSWPLPDVFRWLKREGGLLSMEFARTFNCGLGMVMVVAPKHAEQIITELAACQEKAVVVGTLHEKEDDTAVVFDGMAQWDAI